MRKMLTIIGVLFIGFAGALVLLRGVGNNEAARDNTNAMTFSTLREAYDSGLELKCESNPVAQAEQMATEVLGGPEAQHFKRILKRAKYHETAGQHLATYYIAKGNVKLEYKSPRTTNHMLFTSSQYYQWSDPDPRRTLIHLSRPEFLELSRQSLMATPFTFAACTRQSIPDTVFVPPES